MGYREKQDGDTVGDCSVSARETNDQTGHITDCGRVPRKGVAASRDAACEQNESEREPTKANTGIGGQVSNRPPSNLIDDVKGRVLSSGIDSLKLAVDLVWPDSRFLDGLELIKEKAHEWNKEVAYPFCDEDGILIGRLNVKPYGVRGYEWILTCADFRMRLGDWMRPHDRPSAMVEIGSETLWRLGVENAVDRVREIIGAAGAEICVVKTSRVDLCLDMSLPAAIWNEDLLKYRVCRARLENIHRKCGRLETITLGKGKILARLYDKAAEINNSGKEWMFDQWGIDGVPAEKKIIRIEFQLRREALKSVGVDRFQDLRTKSDRLWAYCTKKWLKFQGRPDAQCIQRNCLPWWETVQGGFGELQGAKPLIRAKAVDWSRKQLMAQVEGVLRTLTALEAMERHGVGATQEEIALCFEWIVGRIKRKGSDENSLAMEVRDKVAKFQRCRAKHQAAILTNSTQCMEEDGS